MTTSAMPLREPVHRMWLGRHQRLLLRDLADRGVWHSDCHWPARRTAETITMLTALANRGLVALDPYHHPDAAWRARWKLTPAGYAWLIADAATDMVGLDPACKAYDRVTSRIGHLAGLARLAIDGPVNRRGERV